MILEQINSKLKNLDYTYWLISLIGFSAAIYGYGFTATILVVLIFGTSFILTDLIFWIPEFAKRPHIKWKYIIIPLILIILDCLFMNVWGLKMTVGLTVVWVTIIALTKLLK